VLTESGGGEEWKGRWRKQLGIVYKREEEGEIVTGIREGKENLRRKNWDRKNDDAPGGREALGGPEYQKIGLDWMVLDCALKL
jgi:hypothetical protein